MPRLQLQQIRMTRQKKSRSLKRIHNIKTGSTSKLKQQNNADRQSGKRVKGKRTLSVFEKFLSENPDRKNSETRTAPDKTTSTSDLHPTKSKKKQEKKTSLLDELDNKDFDDIY